MPGVEAEHLIPAEIDPVEIRDRDTGRPVVAMAGRLPILAAALRAGDPVGGPVRVRGIDHHRAHSRPAWHHVEVPRPAGLPEAGRERLRGEPRRQDEAAGDLEVPGRGCRIGIRLAPRTVAVVALIETFHHPPGGVVHALRSLDLCDLASDHPAPLASAAYRHGVPSFRGVPVTVPAVPGSVGR